MFGVLARSRADLGRSIITQLPSDFLTENRGKFVAIGLKSQRVLALADTLPDLGKKVQAEETTENYYVARIGYQFVAKVQ